MAFLVVIASLVGLTVALYQKAFTPVDKVKLHTDSIGNQLTVHADVKLRGLDVGEVRGITSNGARATLTLALKPSDMNLIPQNVVAQLLPKTLFGEKFVDLVIPNNPSAQHLRAGDTIAQDDSQDAVETEEAINNLLPLLQTLKPQLLSETLDAIATALRGRGNELGATLARTGAYLHRLNPSLPTLQKDFQGLADLANNTADATPHLLEVLDNLSASSRYLVQERSSLNTFLTSTTSFAATAQSIVAQNATRLTALAQDSTASLDLFASYSGEFPCLLKGLAVYEPILEKAFGGDQAGLHITLEVTKDNGGYVAGQEPKYRDTRGPYCQGLPHPVVPAGDTSFNDGYRTSTTPSPDPVASQYLDPTSPQDQSTAALRAVAGGMLGVPADQVPDEATLLLGPATSGLSVGLS